MHIRSFTVAVVCVLICGLAIGQTLPANAKADRVVVMKKERTLTLMSQGKVLKIYKVALGGDPIGAKTRQGDHKTPEGVYRLDRRNAHSKFYKSIHISYPDAKDIAYARKLGVSPGGEFMSMGCPMDINGWVRVIGLKIGRMVALPLPMTKSMRSGGGCRTGHRLKSSLNLTVAGVGALRARDLVPSLPQMLLNQSPPT